MCRSRSTTRGSEYVKFVPFTCSFFVYGAFAQEWKIAVSLLGAGGAVFVVGAVCLCCRGRLHKQGIAGRKATSHFEVDGECPKSSLKPTDDNACRVYVSRN